MTTAPKTRGSQPRFGKSRLFSFSEAAHLSMLSPRTAIATVYGKISGKTPSYPRMILLNLTNRCNFACPMCAVGESRRQELAAGAADLQFELISDVIQQSRRYGSIFHLFGGEPLLYKRVHEVISLVRRNHMIPFLTTNGLLLQKHAAKLVTSGLAVLHVSLDGWDDDSQTKRGNVRGSFDRIIAGVKEVARCRTGKFPIVRMSTVVTKHNYHSLDKIQQVVAGLGVEEWTIANYFFAVRGVAEAHNEFRQRTGIGGALPLHVIDGDHYLSEEQVLDLRTSLARIRKNNERHAMRIDYSWSTDLNAYYCSAKIPSADSKCDFPYSRLDVQPSGLMGFCGGGHTIGDLHSTTVKDAWSGEKASHFRDMHRSHGIFPMCFRCCGIKDTISFADKAFGDIQFEPGQAA
ncbi:MAG TPA: radical SAM/SPASM domain-containing protein [Candidatus Sulfotelmatobacter sp.]|nr:radical SAM/SPASM domain-containing protein [Candidatus Sulfotelmatobacter sp.]